MKFRVKKPFVWGPSGQDHAYEAGDVIEIPDGHPRLNGMFLGNYLTYESGDLVPANQADDPIAIARKAAGLPA
jgi:hypothetical protein